MEPKHIVFFLILFLGVPSAIAMLRSDRRFQLAGMFMMVFTIPFIYSTGINFFTDKFYKGTSRGYEILGTDVIAISMAGMLISLYGLRKFKFLPAGSIFYILYFAISCISIMNAASMLYSGYEVMKMIMVFIYFVTLYNCIMRYKSFDVILVAFGTIIIYTLIHMMIQRLAFGVYQPNGIFPHRNSAAMFANMIAPIFLSIILNANLSKLMFRFYFVAYCCAGIVVVMALSRGSIVLFPIATLIVVYKSLRLKATSRKMKIIGIFAVIALLGFLRAAPMLIDRFENAPKRSGEGRVAFAMAAINMAEDNYFGVGLNNWGLKINPPWTYWEDTGIERRGEDFKSGIVETIYLLVAAECGWIGLASLLMWFGYYYLQNYLNIGRFKEAAGAYMPIGIFGGLTAIFGQSVLEWILKQPTNFYGMMILFAIVAAMTDTYKNHRRANGRQ